MTGVSIAPIGDHLRPFSVISSGGPGYTGRYVGNQMKRILSIDGGGIRGIIPTVVLRAFETYTGRNCVDMFDLLVGTITGGIITLGIAHPNQFGAERLLELFKDKGSAIFNKPRGPLPQLMMGGPKYSGQELAQVLRDYFGEARLRDSKKDVMVTAYDIAERRPRTLKSWNALTDPRRDLSMWEAGLATAAAPTYFPPFHAGERTLVDGGVVANNPSALAFAEAQRRWPQEDILIVSLGTGRVRKPYLASEVKKWGPLEWVGPMIDFLFAGASDSTDYVLEQCLPKGRYYRFQCDVPAECSAMDNASKENIEKLRAIASTFVDDARNEISHAVTALLANCPSSKT